MDLMLILRNLAIILVAAKLCGLLARKLNCRPYYRTFTA